MAATADTEALASLLHEAIQSLHAPTRLASSPLNQFALAERYSKRHPTLTPAHALSKLLDELLSEMNKEQPKLADLLRGRFWEGLTVDEMIARHRPEAQSARRFHHQQTQACTFLAQAWQEAELRLQQQERTNHLLAALPDASYMSLFGAESWIEQALDTLLDPQGAAIITIKGNGGIGKTALADNIVRGLIGTSNEFSHLIWISARQEYLCENGIQSINGSNTRIRPQEIFDELVRKVNKPELVGKTLERQIADLSPILRGQPHLIVIDNLESVHDFDLLTPRLAKLVRPTRFILTSRVTTPSPIAMKTLEIDELQRDAAFALIEHTADHKGVAQYDVCEIYNVVGGSPLALILTVSQMKKLPSEVVLNALRKHSQEPIYRYIYWNSWERLTATSQKVLFIIQRAGDQADWRWLTMRLDEEQAHAAIEELLDLSLVNLRQQNHGNYVYGIHRLTSTFLRAEVLGWI